jgi:Dimethyladenosine transferase (rRNA methylation)
MLTRSLLERGAQVTAIEVDPALCEKLRKQFEHEARFT